MSTEDQKRRILIEKRARALALVLLTGRAGLKIEEVEEDIGLDFVVRFHTPGKRGWREFGVLERGDWAAVTKDLADEALHRVLRRAKSDGPSLRPACLFYFTMEDDGAWYTWVTEPVVSEDGAARLLARDEADCQRLDKRALKEIIKRVDRWHDAVFPNLLMNGPAGGQADRKQLK